MRRTPGKIAKAHAAKIRFIRKELKDWEYITERWQQRSLQSHLEDQEAWEQMIDSAYIQGCFIQQLKLLTHKRGNARITQMLWHEDGYTFPTPPGLM